MAYVLTFFDSRKPVNVDADTHEATGDFINFFKRDGGTTSKFVASHSLANLASVTKI